MIRPRPYAADWRYPWSRDAEPDEMPAVVASPASHGDVSDVRGGPPPTAGTAADPVDGAGWLCGNLAAVALAAVAVGCGGARAIDLQERCTYAYTVRDDVPAAPFALVERCQGQPQRVLCRSSKRLPSEDCR